MKLMYVIGFFAALIFYIKAGVYLFGEKSASNEYTHSAVYFIVKVIFMITTSALILFSLYVRFVDGGTSFRADDSRQFDPR
jgi:hypothetical protein